MLTDPDYSAQETVLMRLAPKGTQCKINKNQVHNESTFSQSPLIIAYRQGANEKPEVYVPFSKCVLIKEVPDAQ